MLENYLQIFVVLTLAILVFSVRLSTTISAPISSLAAAVEASGTTEWETEPPPTKVEGFSGLERLRRTVGSFPTEVGGFKPDFWKMKQNPAR